MNLGQMITAVFPKAPETDLDAWKQAHGLDKDGEPVAVIETVPDTGRYIRPSNQDLTLAELAGAGFIMEGADGLTGAVLCESPQGHHVRVRQNGLIDAGQREPIDAGEYLETIGF